MTISDTNRKDITSGIIVLVAAVLLRAWFYHCGGTFIARPLQFALQYLDPKLLHEDLARSLLYLHSQPPLFNLLLGVVLKCSPFPNLSYWLLFSTIGLLIPLLLYHCLRSIGIGMRTALAATLLFVFNPTLLLYEHLLYYTHLETFFVVLAACSLARWCHTRSMASWCIVLIALLCLALVRSLYHPVFIAGLVIALVCFVFWITQDGRRGAHMLGAAMCIVILPLFLLCIKNYILYDFFGTSSWDGMSLWNKVNAYDEMELEALCDRGIISRRGVEAGFEPFKSIDRYPGLAEQVRCHHPADCALWKSTGKPNFNHSGYVALSRALRSDAIALIRHDPARFALYTAGAYALTLWYSSDSVHALFENNMTILAPLEKLYRSLWFGFLGVHNRHSDKKVWLYAACVTVVYVLVYGAGVRVAWRSARTGRASGGAVALLCMALHGYTLIVSSLIEFGENNRFRCPVDAALLILAATAWVSWRTTRRTTRTNITTREDIL
ncbi:MAG: phospholipid carrier-dependent glycosyltransferase [Desulfobacterota bacterium]|nr:phospholipid carrier-dependent glycosyltransferase [Thermodesulfobacteriota bacterium]